MHRDANLRRRTGLVITGLLLAVYSLAALVYVVALRGDGGTCGDGRQVELFYACRDAGWLLALPLVLGVVLIAVGMVAFPPASSCALGQGTWATAGLVLLASLMVLPAIAAVATYLVQDPALPYGTTVQETEYRLDRLLGLAAVAAGCAFLPYLLLYMGQARSHPCCREAGCFEPCFCDEPTPDAPPMPPVAEVWHNAPAEPAAPPVPAAWERQQRRSAPVTSAAPMWEPVDAAPAASEWERSAAPARRAAPAAKGSKTRKVRKTSAKAKAAKRTS